jgi:hypothetical protein
MDPFPSKIKDIKMGQPMASVIKMIDGSGTYEVKPQMGARRAAVIWNLPESLYYKRMSFQFTEKDRLYLIRFDLKDISLGDLRALKKPIFEKYGISWDDPWRLKVKDDDIVLYGPPDLGTVYCFEFSDRKTGAKALELLQREMSAQDRALAASEKPEAAKEAGSETVGQGESPNESPEKAPKGPSTTEAPHGGE